MKLCVYVSSCVKFVCVWSYVCVCVKLCVCVCYVCYVKFVCVKFVCSVCGGGLSLCVCEVMCVCVCQVVLSLCVCVCVKLCVCVCYVCYVKFVCVKLLSVKFVYVKFVCSEGGGWEEEEEEEEKEEPGIQNQKQEPHTKMWGIILANDVLLLVQMEGSVRYTWHHRHPHHHHHHHHHHQLSVLFSRPQRWSNSRIHEITSSRFLLPKTGIQTTLTHTQLGIKRTKKLDASPTKHGYQSNLQAFGLLIYTTGMSFFCPKWARHLPCSPPAPTPFPPLLPTTPYLAPPRPPSPKATPGQEKESKSKPHTHYVYSLCMYIYIYIDKHTLYIYIYIYIYM